jgi:hypothetical protein
MILKVRQGSLMPAWSLVGCTSHPACPLGARPTAAIAGAANARGRGHVHWSGQLART